MAINFDDVEIDDVVVDKKGVRKTVRGKSKDYVMSGGGPKQDVLFLFEEKHGFALVNTLSSLEHCELIKRQQKQQTEKACTCEIVALCAYGCKCGAFKKSV